MKLLVFLALVACALAHWPYADLIDKFRMAKVFVEGGRAMTLDYYRTTVQLYSDDYYLAQWRFHPWNNQHQPTFLLSFPYRGTGALPQLSDAHPQLKEVPVNYLIQPSHLAEVISTNINSFAVVPHSQIQLNKVSWTDYNGYVLGNNDSVKWDNELFGEQIDFTLIPELDANNDSVLEGNTSVYLHLSLYPDSDDDLVDIEFVVDDYTFVKPGESQLAIFWKISSSNGGDRASAKNLPLSIDWADMSFEVNPLVQVDECTEDRKRQSRKPADAAPAPKKEESRRSRKGEAEKKSSHVRSESVARAEAVRMANNQPRVFVEPTSRTSSQIWLTGGYIVTIIGNTANDYCGGDVDFVSTFSILSRAPKTL